MASLKVRAKSRAYGIKSRVKYQKTVVTQKKRRRNRWKVNVRHIILSRTEEFVRPKMFLARQLSRLACPFTWRSPPMNEEQVHDIVVANGCMVPMVWNEIILKVKLAYRFCVKRHPEQSLPFIAEAYMRLLPGGTFPSHLEDDLVREYGLALRHLVDATWAHICRYRLYPPKRKRLDSSSSDAGSWKASSSSSSEDGVCKNCGHHLDPDEDSDDDEDPEPLRVLIGFVKKIGASEDLPTEQQAALMAIRAKCEHYPANIPLARGAIKMNSQEGQWHAVLAKLMGLMRTNMKEAGKTWPHSMHEETTAATKAFQLRKNPETYMVYSHMHDEMGFCSKALDIIKEGLSLFPRSAWLLTVGANMVRNAQRPIKDVRQAVRWYEKALECGGDNPENRFNLATALFERGEWLAAQEHAKRAAPHVTEAREMLAFITLAMETRPEIRTNRGVNLSLHGLNTYFMKGNPGCPGRRGRR